MKKVMIALLTAYAAIILIVVVGRFANTLGLLIMLAILLATVTPIVINDLVMKIRLKKSTNDFLTFKRLDKARKNSYKVMYNILVSKNDLTQSKLNIASYHLIKGNLKEFNKWIDQVEMYDLKTKQMMLTYLALKKDYYFIVNDKEKYENVINFMHENMTNFPVELKNDIDSDRFIFDLRDGFVDFNHEKEMLEYMKSYINDNKIYYLNYYYTLALIRKCRNQENKELEVLKNEAKGTFYTILLKDFD